MNKQQAYNAFFSRFGVFAFEENTVPTDDVFAKLIESGNIKSKFPYITYQVITDSLDHAVFPTASIWDKGSSWERADLLANTIAEYTQNNAPTIRLDDGRMFITKGSPFAQHQQDEADTDIRRIILTFGVEFFTEY